MRPSRLFAVALAAVTIVLIVAPLAAAVDEEPPVTEETTTTVADGDGPAVVIPPEEPEESEQPWTDRFLIPTLVATAVLVIAGTTLFYFARVKGRYRVVGSE